MSSISVIVCTHNRHSLLLETLSSLASQTLDKALYEVIVVDNASTDNTTRAIQEFQGRHPACTIRYVRDDVVGLGHARNTGVRHARGGYVAFIDDDARAASDWLATALSSFAHIQPTPLGIGGIILPVFDSPKPCWFKDEYEARTCGDRARFLCRDESLCGSNMIFRSDVPETFGGFDERVGVTGHYLSVGEETALLEKIWERMGEAQVLYYSPRLVVFHAVPGHKMTLSYQLKRAFVTGQSAALRHLPDSPRQAVERVTRILYSIAKRTASAAARKGRYPTYQNWIAECGGPIAVDVGILAGLLRLFVPVRQRPR